MSSPSVTPRRSPRYTWSVVALVAGIVLAPVAFVSHHAVSLATDTDRVANAMEPLIDEPIIRDGLISQITAPLESFLTSDAIIQRIVDQAGLGITVPGFLDDVAGALLQPIIDDTLTRIRGGITTIIGSDAFTSSWRQMVADTHVSFSAIMTSDSFDDSQSLALSLRPFVVGVQEGLVDQGFSFLSDVVVPPIGVTILGPESLESMRSSYQIARVMEPWSIALAGVLIAGAVIAFPRRETAWAVAGGGVALGMVAVVVSLWLVRSVWVPLQYSDSPEVATLIADALLAYPIGQAMTIAVIAATVGGVGWVIESRIRQQKAMT